MEHVFLLLHDNYNNHKSCFGPLFGQNRLQGFHNSYTGQYQKRMDHPAIT